ncbi:zinc finger, C3HC4 type family protein isoform X2 [Zea mays]|uniref:zinc finger, C3HC4 type family protein isoform X2 n=1 Tax=Zea mays TaxID=4577 RepID=UPI0009A9B9E3|nr:zinc finger, C3HC4 type family protein isoform X2 [Zea mays]|eukprot:XP_020408990.1 zinc finger, C3HC4 type family protein isoform X2 [Zea mays]
MIWVLFIMQLASHGTQTEETMQFVPHCDHAEVSDSQSTSSQLNLIERSTEHLASCEINPVSVDDDNDNEHIDANEETHLVIQDVPQCRICLDSEGDDLIAPCRCKGTQKYVHRSCLDNWRSTKVVAFMGMVIYRFYGDELREMFGYEEHPYAFYAMAIVQIAVLAIVLVGLLYGFFIAIICGQRITERHYHVLAKQELTKEYIVEDLEGADHVPDLDPSHVIELKILGLY